MVILVEDKASGIAGEPIDAKLYYFDKVKQKYQLCGSGIISMEDNYYSFEIDHCSSYVMSEEPLPDEFVIDSAKEDKEDTKKEESNKEEPKKEETKKEDTTTATGKIPYAGGTTVIVIAMLAIVAVGIIAYMKNKELRGI